ncbi:hypothetical protein Clocel_0819 [Clostridium cellulovorans 743B]|uniref:Uncharacterized protein n=1 Tax=Clostridium cellulovorans (strain ATCC 35296 / DSM 3052 / OCM 3 / 743B) TaxID=573061 RepID=D9SSJ2_CLOC7|nr:hypothetical protein Clocel_0819 [Clostridium cellulovorans 743B]
MERKRRKERLSEGKKNIIDGLIFLDYIILLLE